MEIIDYLNSLHKEKWLKQFESCEWDAGKFLASLLKENKFHSMLGGWAKLFLLVDEDSLVSFVTYSAQDCISDPTLTPWLGFFHTAPEYRGNRYGKLLIDHASEVAKKEGYNAVYLATDHIGLYEKYGFEYMENRLDVWGEDSRIYKRKL